MSNHSFNPLVAKKLGIIEAIIINTIIFWTQTNAAKETNFFDGRFWCFGTPEYFSRFFTYLTPRQIKYALKKLIDSGVLLKGNYNKKGYDKTAWYALSDNILIDLNLDKTCLQPAPSLIEQNCPMDRTKLSYGQNKIVLPIPDTKPDTKQDKKTTNCKPPSSSSFFFSKTIDENLLKQKLERDKRSNEQFMTECISHVDNDSDPAFPRLQRAAALVKLLKQLNESDIIFNEISKEKKKAKFIEETDEERANRQFFEYEHQKERENPGYVSKYLEQERKLETTKSGYKSKYL